MRYLFSRGRGHPQTQTTLEHTNQTYRVVFGVRKSTPREFGELGRYELRPHQNRLLLTLQITTKTRSYVPCNPTRVVLWESFVMVSLAWQVETLKGATVGRHLHAE
jgi:hypothetical protein